MKIATYKDIQNYIKEKYNISIKTCWIAHMKEVCGLKPRMSSNRIDTNKRKYPCPEDKQEIVLEAFRQAKWID